MPAYWCWPGAPALERSPSYALARWHHRGRGDLGMSSPDGSEVFRSGGIVG